MTEVSDGVSDGIAFLTVLSSNPDEVTVTSFIYQKIQSGEESRNRNTMRLFSSIKSLVMFTSVCHHLLCLPPAVCLFVCCPLLFVYGNPICLLLLRKGGCQKLFLWCVSSRWDWVSDTHVAVPLNEAIAVWFVVFEVIVNWSDDDSTKLQSSSELVRLTWFDMGIYDELKRYGFHQTTVCTRKVLLFWFDSEYEGIE